MIEACGVPHPEVEVILANGAAVDFSYRVQDGDRISVNRFKRSRTRSVSSPAAAVIERSPTCCTG